MKHFFIINPAAGKKDRSAGIIEKIDSVMCSRSLEYEYAITSGPMDAAALARREAEKGEPLRIYACGGDGTLNEVVNGAVGFDNVEITHFPTGSGNDFIKIFGKDAKRFQNLDELLNCESSELDLIECNGRYSINICSVGFDARIGFGMLDFKKLPLVTGKGAYILSAISNTVKGIHLPYVVRFNGKTYDGRYTLFVIANGRFYGGSFNPIPEAMPDDGKLDILLVNSVSRATVVSFISKFAKGQHAKYPFLMQHFTTDMFEVEFDRPTDINVDGEKVTAETCAVIKLSDKKIRFFYPRGATWLNNGNDLSKCRNN